MRICCILLISLLVTQSAAFSSSSPRQKPIPWKAGYYTSIKTQKKIQQAQGTRSILQTFLQTPPERCNSANVLCALTLSAKTRNDENVQALLGQTIQIVHDLMKQDLLTIRQLCNAAWAIAKHYDRNNDLLSTKLEGGEGRIDDTVDLIAEKITQVLDENPLAAKEGELAMAAWAYGVLRHRKRPPGWASEPKIGILNRKQQGPAKFYQIYDWKKDDELESITECLTFDPPTVTDTLLDSIAGSLMYSENATQPEGYRLEYCRWSEMANIAWAFASHGLSCSPESESLLLGIAQESAARLRQATFGDVLSRDIAQIAWALGTLQADNFRLADGLIELTDAMKVYLLGKGTPSSRNNPFTQWTSADLVQVALSFAHARLDEVELLSRLYEEVTNRLEDSMSPFGRRNFQAWEVSILLWAQARLYLTTQQHPIFARFPGVAIRFIQSLASEYGSLQRSGIGAQEQANLAWSLTVLEQYKDQRSIDFLSKIFDEAAKDCEEESGIQLEHAHQLWQSLFVLEEFAPLAVMGVPLWFREYLHDKWQLEKMRAKKSSARHKSLSKLLDLMGIAHFNEHDEDIDVALILKPNATWTSDTLNDDGTVTTRRVAVEFDGPNHFTRQPKDGKPRALGHTVLKYRLLKRQGWSVVRVPYFEFDRIPFWASMERQRYLQRLLKTHSDLRFSQVDVSEYKPPVRNRKSRFD